MPAKKHETVFSALNAAQNDITTPPKDGENRAFGGKVHKYTTLGALLDHIKPTLKKHGLVVYIRYQPGTPEDYAVLNIHHLDSGETIESEMALLLENRNNWAQGSSCTYTARYLIEGMFMVPGVDDDGVASSKVPAAERGSASAPQNPLMAIPNPQKMVEAIVNEAGKKSPEEDPQGWADRIKLIDEVLEAKGWKDEALIIAHYEPIKSAVNLHVQGKEAF